MTLVVTLNRSGYDMDLIKDCDGIAGLVWATAQLRDAPMCPALCLKMHFLSPVPWYLAQLILPVILRLSDQYFHTFLGVLDGTSQN